MKLTAKDIKRFYNIYDYNKVQIHNLYGPTEATGMSCFYEVKKDFELDEVMNLADRILVMYEGEIVGELNPKTTTEDELGLYMAGAKRDEVKA